mmetsp:Transcript_88349/g.202037  ORF Transcript_88349/g.202037 Transcript_88349/m.202037 type:complete len:296 (-) Transcript_88349:695-1582(-)
MLCAGCPVSLLVSKILYNELHVVANRVDLALGKIMEFPTEFLFPVAIILRTIHIQQLLTQDVLRLAKCVGLKHVIILQQNVVDHPTANQQHQHKHNYGAPRRHKRQDSIVLELPEQAFHFNQVVLRMTVMKVPTPLTRVEALQLPGDTNHASKLKYTQAKVGPGGDGKCIIVQQHRVHEGDHRRKSIRKIFEITSPKCLPIENHEYQDNEVQENDTCTALVPEAIREIVLQPRDRFISNRQLKQTQGDHPRNHFADSEKPHQRQLRVRPHGDAGQPRHPFLSSVELRKCPPDGGK